MSAPLVVPFNFQPSAVSVKTGSYTIPAGKYAKVTVNLEGSATFTIGGVTAIRGTQNSVLGSSLLTTFNGGGAGSADNNSLSTGVPTSENSAGAAFSSATDQKTVIAELWLPTGTVIDGTGTWRAVVQEFNNIT